MMMVIQNDRNVNGSLDDYAFNSEKEAYHLVKTNLFIQFSPDNSVQLNFKDWLSNLSNDDDDDDNHGDDDHDDDGHDNDDHDSCAAITRARSK